MLEWIIGTLADLLGLSPTAVVAVLVVASVGGSAALRWYRNMRHQENYYIELARSGAAFGYGAPGQSAPGQPARDLRRVQRPRSQPLPPGAPRRPPRRT